MAYNPNDEAPAERPLKAYAFDPSQGRNLGNYMAVNVRNEASDDPPTVLLPGPVGKYLAVIDYDASNNKNRVVRSDSLKLAGTTGAQKGPELDEMPKGFVQGDFWYDYLVKLK